ncbi:amidase [Nocardia beijingensis]|uniref:amidase n=1 Tax=Nocardia beijingensis TaxID=95162 RepID=UPI0008314094|nr:amidase [Nocardia beijingensis]
MTGFITDSLLDGYFSGRSLTTLGRDLRSGRTSSAALVEHALESIARLDPIVNAFVSVSADTARAAARAADAELGSGLDRGPLHGIPVAIKDIVDIVGQVTGCGSNARPAQPATADADCTAVVRAAGAVIIGKTVLHEFAYGATGDRSAQGPSRNPHDPGRISGGSSGGSAVAVAAGMVPLAIGTDTAGSVRVPAALCGVVGFKPAFDAISTRGVFPLAPTLDHVGLFARSVEDTATAYRILARADVVAVQAPLRQLAWIEPEALGPVDPRVADCAIAAVRAAGISATSIDLGHGPGDLFELFTTLQASEVYAVHAEARETYTRTVDPSVLARIDRGAEIPAWRYIHAGIERTRFSHEIGALLERFDALVLPTAGTIATRLGESHPDIGGATYEVRAALLALTSPWNLTGSPALTIPVGTVEGLPTGLQIVCAPGRESVLWQLAGQIEAAIVGKSHLTHVTCDN